MSSRPPTRWPRDGIETTVIDVATLKPLDMKTILASVEKTGRCVVVHEAPLTAGFGAEIAARLAEQGLTSLLAPVLRVAGYDTVMPLPRLESRYMPGKGRILAAARRRPGVRMKSVRAARPRRGSARGRDRRLACLGRRSRCRRPAAGLGGDGEGGRRDSGPLVGPHRQAPWPAAAIAWPSERRWSSTRKQQRARFRHCRWGPSQGRGNHRDHRRRARRVGAPSAGIKATPAVRALARKLGVDLGAVAPGGADGLSHQSRRGARRSSPERGGPTGAVARGAPRHGRQHDAVSRRGGPGHADR